MKKLILIHSLFFFMALRPSAQTDDSLYKLYKAKQFPELERDNTDKKHALYFFYKAVYANVSNQPASSNQYLDTFILNKKKLPNAIGFAYWRLRNDNDVKLFDYKNAYATQLILLKKYKKKYSKRDYTAEKYTGEIWRTLANEKPQRTERTGSTTLPLTRDLAGLINIRVKAGDTDTSFVFDTGAGMSSITESLAQKMKLRILPGKEIKVSGFNNVFNPVQIAVADELHIGDIVIRNEPFLVFKDEALSFAGGAYKINGIIGFPIAKELGSLTITPTELLVNDLSKEDKTTEKNLFIELLHPVIFLKYKERLLPFNFDTGANTSQFSKTFFDAYGKELEAANHYETKQNASAGGVRTYKALIADTLVLWLGTHQIGFSKMEIDAEDYHVSGEELYGNIGQDLLKRYKKVTINFKNSYLKLED